MSMPKPINIPVVSAPPNPAFEEKSNCADNELVVLMVMGDSMVPEFIEGEILVIEMGIPAQDGAFVIGTANDEFIFRQLKRDAQGGWWLHALNPAYSDIAIPDLKGLKGVVTQKRHARSRKSVKYYGA